MKVQIHKTNKGKHRDEIGSSDWEPIPEKDKPQVTPIGIARQVLKSDLDAALEKAQRDTNKHNW